MGEAQPGRCRSEPPSRWLRAPLLTGGQDGWPSRLGRGRRAASTRPARSLLSAAPVRSGSAGPSPLPPSTLGAGGLRAAPRWAAACLFSQRLQLKAWGMPCCESRRRVGGRGLLSWWWLPHAVLLARETGCPAFHLPSRGLGSSCPITQMPSGTGWGAHQLTLPSQCAGTRVRLSLHSSNTAQPGCLQGFLLQAPPWSPGVFSAELPLGQSQYCMHSQPCAPVGTGWCNCLL